MLGAADDELTQTKLTTFFLLPDEKRSSSGVTKDINKSPFFERLRASDPDETPFQTWSASALSQEQVKSNVIQPKLVRQHSSTNAESRAMLAQTAQETKRLLPCILKMIPHAPPNGCLFAPPTPPKLHVRYCPRFLPVEVKVINADAFDTAISVANCAQYITVRDKHPVCILNMANAYSAGGGWMNGALAQEEALCYRSSLSFTLKLRYYPLEDDQAIYSPTVIIFRENLERDHKLLDLTKPDELPIVSVISIAALCRPFLDDSGPLPKYKYPKDREIMKEKMRIILRISAYNGHRRIVLGALGCGAFLNPREEVADCWVEVLAEAEFGGGWWESIVFAIMDDLNEGKKGDGNFGVFYRKLHGITIR